MTKPTCPLCGAELHKDGVWWFRSEDICLLCDTALSEEDLSRVAERQAHAVAEAVKAWRDALDDMTTAYANSPNANHEWVKFQNALALLAREEHPC